MSAPSPQRYASGARRHGIGAVTLENALAAFARIRATDPRITPVLTLRHFSILTDLPYLFLRRTVARRGHEIEVPSDVLKDPFILEFLGLDERSACSAASCSSISSSASSRTRTSGRCRCT